MRDPRYNQRIAGSRFVRRRRRQPLWWVGLSWDRLLAYGITAVVSLVFLWLLAQIALDVAIIVLLSVLLTWAVVVWYRRCRGPRH